MDLEQMCKSLYLFDVHITSNQIKNAVIFHHYECKHERTCNLAPCLLDIIEKNKYLYETRQMDEHYEVH